MKKNQIMVMDNGNGLVTKAFAKQAKIFGTPEYKMWREFKKENPEAEMEIRTIKKNTKKDTYRKNMTYNNMREYISVQANSESNLVEFEKLLVESKLQTCPYDYVAHWFIAKFPKYKEHSVFKVVSNEENANSDDRLSPAV